MKIKRFHLPSLRNDEFFQYMTRIRSMIAAAKPEVLDVEVLYGEFNILYADLDEAIKKISKSAHTARIAELDHARDTVFSGMAGQVRSNLHHFDAVKRAAAERLAVVFDAYGNVAARAGDEETSAIYNLLGELTGKHADDLQALGLGEWGAELDRRNRAFETAMMERFEEAKGRTTLVMRTCRIAIGDAYSRLADRIDALQIVEGAGAANSAWGTFIAELNEIIGHTENITAIRRSKAAAGKTEKEAGA